MLNSFIPMVLMATVVIIGVRIGSLMCLQLLVLGGLTSLPFYAIFRNFWVIVMPFKALIVYKDNNFS
jgi:hypothetical protein